GGLRDGWYSFMSVDKAGNSSEVYFVCLDRSTPMITIADKNNNTYTDSSKLSKIAYFSVEEQYNSKFTYDFFRKINGSFGDALSVWSNYQDKTIYFDVRIVDFNTIIPSDNLRKIFYEQSEAYASVKQTEMARVKGPMEYWSSAVTGTILEQEEIYSTLGAPYYTYTESSGEKYIFFSIVRLEAYVDTRISSYVGLVNHNYFWEEGEFKVVVTDEAGNASTKYFTIDLTMPLFVIKNQITVADNKKTYSKSDIIYEGTDSLTGIEKIEYRKGESGPWTVLNDAQLTITASISNQGVWEIRCFDGAGNMSAETKITLDSIDPELFLSGSNTSVYYKSGEIIQLNIQETNGKAIFLKTGDTTETITYSSSHSKNASGLSDASYSFVVEDYAGNTASIVFVVDKTNPSLSTNGDLFGLGSSVVIYVADVNLDELYLNDQIETRREISIDDLSTGDVTLKAIDFAGNITTKAITIDKDPPEFELNEFYNANTYVEFVVTENGAGYTVYLDGLESTTRFNFAGASNNGYGSHTIRVTDRAGNSTIKSFFYGTLAPAVSFIVDSETKDGRVYVKDGKNIELKVQEQQYNRTIMNGDPFVLTQISTSTYSHSFDTSEMNEGSYQFTIYDNAENTAIITLIVDKTNPTIKVSTNNVERNDGFYFSEATISVIASDNASLFTLFWGNSSVNSNAVNGGVNIDKASSLIAEGKNILIATDNAGNETRYEFTKDSKKPELFILKNNVTIDLENAAMRGGRPLVYIKGDDIIDINVIDDNPDNIEIQKGIVKNIITEFLVENWLEGSYELKVYDKAGNTTDVIFVVDKIAPVLTLLRDDASVPDGTYISNGRIISYSYLDSNKGSILRDGLETSNKEWSSSQFTEGAHTLTAIDLAGNATSVTFYVDKTAPNVMLSGGTGAYFNAKNQISLNIVEINIEKIELKEDGLLKTGIFTNETSQVIRVDNLEGSYELKVYDKAGNTTDVIFVVDKIAPVLTLKRGGLSVSDGAFYSLAYAVSYIHEDANKGKLTLDETDTSNENFRVEDLDDGMHILTATDLAGNATSATFYIDKIAPKVTLSGGTGAYFNAKNLLRFEIVDVNIDQMALYDLNAITPYSVFEATANLEILAV
ncbi:MAG: Ig-like domain repeat protein, partial [Christensenellaceae bacterium]|nr:Ig-like domain repeat protein [Christensenellaceae bacterium]